MGTPWNDDVSIGEVSGVNSVGMVEAHLFLVAVRVREDLRDVRIGLVEQIPQIIQVWLVGVVCRGWLVYGG